MKKNNFWYSIALLLSVSGLAVPALAIPPAQVDSEAKVAQANPVWSKISLTKVVGGLEQPVHITHAGDRSGRLFVVEQKGRIRIVKNGVLQSQPFLDITNRVSCCGERGLLSVAFPPNYASKKYFYVN